MTEEAPKSRVGGVDVFIAVMPDGKAWVPFVVNGVGVAFPFDQLPDVIRHLQEMVVEGPAIVEQLRLAQKMGESVGGIN